MTGYKNIDSLVISGEGSFPLVKFVEMLSCKIVKDGNAEIEIDDKGIIKQITISHWGTGHIPKQKRDIQRLKEKEDLYRKHLTKDSLPEDTKSYDTDCGSLWYNRKIEQWCNHYGDVFYPTYWFEKI